MKVIWTPEAEDDRAAICDHISADDPRAAAKMDAMFERVAERLSTFPLSARPGQMPGTRELIPHENYRIVYEVGNETVWILALIHTARQWPPAMEEDD